jgi:hypothetical protein
MCHVAHSRIEFLEPWHDFVPGQGNAFLQELKRELCPGHPLEGLDLVPLGHSGAADDALFEAEDGRVFQVHLTFGRDIEQPPIPHCRAYPSADEWVRQVMLPANEKFFG